MKTTQTSGKRKRATARAVLTPGKGNVFVNGKPSTLITPELAQLKMLEPVILAGKAAEKYDIHVTVQGGGVNGQAEAVRLAISRALSEAVGDKLKNVYLEYDRALLIADVRRKESSKPNSHGKARAKRQKSYR
jgi:small subunit ribosomal protein S9